MPNKKKKKKKEEEEKARQTNMLQNLYMWHDIFASQ